MTGQHRYESINIVGISMEMRRDADGVAANAHVDLLANELRD